MPRTDAIAYIPLFCTAGIALILCILLAIIKIRNTAKVSFVSFLSLGIVIFACLHTVFVPGITPFAILLLLAFVLMVPYAVMLMLGKVKEPTVIIQQAEEKAPETVIQELTQNEINLFDQGRGFLLQAADTFSKKEGFQEFLDNMAKTIGSVTKSDGAIILLVDDFEDVITVKSFNGDFPPPYKLPNDLPHKPLRVSTSFKFAQFPLRDNIFGEVASAGKAELIAEPAKDPRIVQNGPEDFLKCGSYMFYPIKSGDIVIGVIALSRNPDKEAFGEAEFGWGETLVDFASTALLTTYRFRDYKDQQELTKETDIASNIQSTIIEKKLPPVPGLSVGAFIDQTSGVCSDFYDVIPARKDRVSFVLMDVAGKGMNSLMVMIMLRAMLRLITNTTQSAATILSWANRGICSDSSGLDHFASVALINYNPVTKKFQLTSGGSTPVYAFSPSKGTFTRLSAQADPVGVEKTTAYKDFEFTGTKGDIIIVFSDGLVEALNAQGKPYSLASLQNAVKANAALAGKDIANKIKDDIKKFIGAEKLHDDQTLLVAKIQ